MSALQNIPIDLDIFYRNLNIPKIALGDKVKVTIYLELPKEVEEGQKKEKERNEKVKDLEFVDQFRKQLLRKKESAPIRKKKEEIEVVFEPEPDIRIAVDNTKKGLL